GFMALGALDDLQANLDGALRRVELVLDHELAIGGLQRDVFLSNLNGAIFEVVGRDLLAVLFARHVAPAANQLSPAELTLVLGGGRDEQKSQKEQANQSGQAHVFSPCQNAVRRRRPAGCGTLAVL